MSPSPRAGRRASITEALKSLRPGAKKSPEAVAKAEAEAPAEAEAQVEAQVEGGNGNGNGKTGVSAAESTAGGGNEGGGAGPTTPSGTEKGDAAGGSAAAGGPVQGPPFEFPLLTAFGEQLDLSNRYEVRHRAAKAWCQYGYLGCTLIDVSVSEP